MYHTQFQIIKEMKGVILYIYIYELALLNKTFNYIHIKLCVHTTAYSGNISTDMVWISDVTTSISVKLVYIVCIPVTY